MQFWETFLINSNFINLLFIIAYIHHRKSVIYYDFSTKSMYILITSPSSLTFSMFFFTGGGFLRIVRRPSISMLGYSLW